MNYRNEEISTFLRLGTSIGIISSILIVWLIVAKVDIVAQTSGKIIPESKNHIISVLETSSIDKVLVKEGDFVKKGQIVALLDTINTAANQQQIENELFVNQIKLEGIHNLLNNKPISFNPSLLRAINNQSTEKYQEIKGNAISYNLEQKVQQISLEIHSRKLQYDSQISSIQSEINQMKHEILSNQTNINKLERGRNSWQQQKESYTKLQETGFAGKLMAEEKMREAEDKIADIEIQKHLTTSVKDKLTQSQFKLQLATNEFRQSLLKEQTDIIQKIDNLQQDKIKAAHNIQLKELLSPIDGYVKDILTTSHSAVVSEGNTLMTIVPSNDILKADILVQNSDIGFIELGQVVKLKVETYSFQKYGLITGKVEKISPDSIENKETKQNFFPVTISLSQNYILKDDKKYYIKPGMNVNADLIINKRTVLEYLTSPLKKTLLETAHEK